MRVGKVVEKRCWVERSERIVEGQGWRRSREGLGVKLKSPRRRGGVWGVRVGMREEVRNWPRAEGPVQGQYELVRVKE